MSEKINSKKIVTRKCIVTNQIVNVDQLIRINFDKKSNKISLDLHRQLHNRGAYFIYSPENWERFKKNKALNRTFRTNVSNEVYLQLEEQLKEIKDEQKQVKQSK